MKFSYNYQGGKEEVICHTCMKKIDSASWKIVRSCLGKQTGSYFLPINIAEETEGYAFVYDMRGMINLRAWMYEAIEKEQLRMKQEIIEKQQEIYEMGISKEQLITEDKYMYVDEKTQHIRFICIPAMSEDTRHKEQISRQSIPKQVYDRETEVGYEMEPSLPLTPPVPSEGFLNMESKASESVMLEYPDFLQDKEENAEKDYAEETEEPIDFYDTSRRKLFQENETQLEKEEMDGSETTLGFTRLTGAKLGKDKPVGHLDIDTKEAYVDDTENVDTNDEHPEDVSSDDEDKTILLNQKTDDDGEDKTILLRPTYQIKASLHRVRTGKKIKLEKNVTIIGKSKMRADIVIEENPAISRKHCTIYFENGTYYLEDNNSSNGTWVENEKVQPEEKVVLQNESKIRLSDENFIFYIE